MSSIQTVRPLTMSGTLTPISPAGDLGSPSTVAVRLSWDRTAPLIVTAIIGRGDRAETWTVGRDLLTDGLTAPSGCSRTGSILVRPETHPAGPQLLISLVGDDPDTGAQAMAQLVMWHGPVARWLRDTLTVVPRGEERIHIPSTVAELSVWAGWTA